MDVTVCAHLPAAVRAPHGPWQVGLIMDVTVCARFPAAVRAPHGPWQVGLVMDVTVCARLPAAVRAPHGPGRWAPLMLPQFVTHSSSILSKLSLILQSYFTPFFKVSSLYFDL